MAFRDLVDLVRDDRIRPDDLVRGSWERQWRRASDVIGLFYMAGREDLVASPEATDDGPVGTWCGSGERGAQADPRLEAGQAEPAEEATWQRRVRELHRQDETAVAEAADATSTAGPPMDFLSAGAAAPSRLSRAVQRAVVHTDERDRKRRSRVRWTFGRSASILGAGRVLRCVLSLSAAGLVWLAVADWSHRETIRFPRRSADGVQPYVFPVVGACSRFQYAVLMGDAVLLAGAIGYGTARLLESKAEG